MPTSAAEGTPAAQRPRQTRAESGPPPRRLRPAAEAADPRVHQLLFERQAAVDAGDSAAVERVAAALAALGYR